MVDQQQIVVEILTTYPVFGFRDISINYFPIHSIKYSKRMFSIRFWHKGKQKIRKKEFEYGKIAKLR